MKINLLEGERIDDLNRNGYKIIQNKEKFCFGMDAVLLTGFAKIKEGERVIDLGTGTGVIPILLEAKTKGALFTGLEIQKDSADMARRSIVLNNLEGKVEIVEGDIKEASALFKKASFDVVTTNPPYMNINKGLTNPESAKAIARHEILCSLEDIVRETKNLLRPGGRLYMVHRPQRLAQIMYELQKNKIEPKRMQMVHSYINKPANMVLLEAVRGGGPMLKIEKPLIIYNKEGIYTKDIMDIYL